MMSSLVTPIVCIVKSVSFTQKCEGYLKQTADASTVTLALDRIDKAIDYIESHNLTDGYTSILWRTEDENVGFWYDNIIYCKAELERSVDASQLEQSNVLMRVRESLTDMDESGTSLTIPTGISRHPNNARFCFLGFLSFFLFVVSICVMAESL